LLSTIPSNPDHTYVEKGWKGSGDWLGTGRISIKRRVHRPFEEAREFVRSLHLKSTKEWLKFTKGQMPEKGTLPFDIPANPCGAYRNNCTSPIPKEIKKLTFEFGISSQDA